MSIRTFAAIGALTLAACSQQATITRTDGPPVDGVIVGSSPRIVFVAPAAHSPDEAIRRADLLAVPKRTIVNVDHPGLGHEIGGWSSIGASVLAFGATGVIHHVSNLGDQSEGAEPAHLAMPVAAGAVFLAAGIALVSWAWGVEARSRLAAGPFDASIAARRAAYPPYIERRQRHARQDRAIAVQLGIKSAAYSKGDGPSLGLTAGFAVPIAPRIRAEPAAEVDVANASSVTIVRLPLRLGATFRILDADYRLHIVPELGYSAVIPGDDDRRNVQHGITGGLMIAHTVPWDDQIELELGHGITATRFYDPASLGPNGGRLTFGALDLVHLRLAVRYRL